MSQIREVRGVATSVFTDSEGTHVVYHSTKVVTIHKDRSVTFRTGGWKTATTRTRMNQACNQYGLNLSVFQKNFAWFVQSHDDRFPWVVPFDGNEIHIPCANGQWLTHELAGIAGN